MSRRATVADGVVLLSLAVVFYAGLTLATNFGRQQPAAAQVSLAAEYA